MTYQITKTARDKKVLVSFTEEEKEILEAKAAEHNMPLSTFIYVKSVSDEHNMQTKFIENILHEMQEIHSEEIREFREEYQRDMKVLATILRENFYTIGKSIGELAATGSIKVENKKEAIETKSETFKTQNERKKITSSSGITFYSILDTFLDYSEDGGLSKADTSFYKVSDIFIYRDTKYQIEKINNKHSVDVINMKTKEREQNFSLFDIFPQISDVFRKEELL